MQCLHDPQIDRDHDFLINRFSDLYGTLCWEASEHSANVNLLDELKTHVFEHFTREEREMKTMCFPDLAQHRRAHPAVRRAFIKGLKNLESNHASLQEFLLHMRERFLTHIVTWDRVFEEWLAQRPGSITATHA